MRERGAKGRAFVGVFDRLLDTVYGCTKRRGGLPNAVLVDEGLRDAEAVVDGTQCGGFGYPDILDGDGRVIGGHVERPAQH